MLALSYPQFGPVGDPRNPLADRRRTFAIASDDRNVGNSRCVNLPQRARLCAGLISIGAVQQQDRAGLAAATAGQVTQDSMGELEIGVATVTGLHDAVSQPTRCSATAGESAGSQTNLTADLAVSGAGTVPLLAEQGRWGPSGAQRGPRWAERPQCWVLCLRCVRGTALHAVSNVARFGMGSWTPAPNGTGHKTSSGSPSRNVKKRTRQLALGRVRPNGHSDHLYGPHRLVAFSGSAEVSEPLLLSRSLAGGDTRAPVTMAPSVSYRGHFKGKQFQGQTQQVHYANMFLAGTSMGFRRDIDGLRRHSRLLSFRSTRRNSATSQWFARVHQAISIPRR